MKWQTCTDSYLEQIVFERKKNPMFISKRSKNLKIIMTFLLSALMILQLFLPVFAAEGDKDKLYNNELDSEYYVQDKAEIASGEEDVDAGGPTTGGENEEGSYDGDRGDIQGANFENGYSAGKSKEEKDSEPMESKQQESQISSNGSGNDISDYVRYSNLTLTIDGEGNEISENTVVTYDDINEHIILQLDWEMEDDSVDFNLKAGNWAKIKIPDTLKGVTGQMNGNLLDEDRTIIGTYEIDDDNYLVLTFNDKLEGDSNRTGKVGFRLQFDEERFLEEAIQEIAFEHPEKTYSITIKPEGEDYQISKTGAPNSPINGTFINWVVDINTTLTQLTDGYVEDYIPYGLKLDFESIEVYELSVGMTGTLGQVKKIPANIEAIKGNDETIGFKIELGETNKAYRIKYKTDIIDFDVSEGYKNIAHLRDGENGNSGDFTIDPIDQGSLIDKEGEADNDAKKITWIIDINKAEEDLENVLVYDDDFYLIRDEEKVYGWLQPGNSTIKIYELKKNADGSVWERGKDITESFYSLNNVGEGETLKFPIKFGDLKGHAYRIVFDMDIDYKAYYPANIFENTAKVTSDGKEESAINHVIVQKSPLLLKDAKDVTSYGDPVISWTLHINEARHSLKDAIAYDTIPEGLELDTGSIIVYKNGTKIEGNEVNSLIEIIETEDENSKIKINLGTTGDYYKIHYNTEVTDPSKGPFDNTLKLEGEGLEGEGIIGQVITINKEGILDTSNIYDKSTVGTQTSVTVGKGDESITYDGINYADKTMSWKLNVDAIKEEITELTIIDTFDPQCSMVFIEDSLRVVVNGTIIRKDEDYTISPITVDGETEGSYAKGFVLEYKGNIARAKHEIYYKTTFDPDEVIDAGGIINENADRKYRNIANFNGKTINVIKQVKEFNVNKNASYQINNTIFNGGKKEGVLDREGREITWTIYVNALGQDLRGEAFVIKDTFSKEQLIDATEFVTDNLKVYEYEVSKNGSFTLAEPPIASSNYSVEFANSSDMENFNFKLTFADGIDKPYAVQFTTSIEGLSEETYTNTAGVEGKDLEKTYDNKVEYEDHDVFIVKELDGITGNNVYTDQELNWEVEINKSLSDIKNATFEDVINSGHVYVNGSLKLLKFSYEANKYDEVPIVKKEGDGELDPNEYRVIAGPDEGETTIKLYLGDIKDMYLVTYDTVVIFKDGIIRNHAKLKGTDFAEGKTDDEEYFAKQSSWGTGSGVPNMTVLTVKKVDQETGAPIEGAGFSLYYLLNGDKRYIEIEDKTVFYTDAEGEIKIPITLKRKYYVEEVEVPDGYEIDTESQEIVIIKDTPIEERILEFKNQPKKTGIWEPNVTKTLSGKNIIHDYKFEIYDVTDDADPGQDNLIMKSKALTKHGRTSSVGFDWVSERDKEGIIEFSHVSGLDKDEQESNLEYVAEKTFLIKEIPLVQGGDGVGKIADPDIGNDTGYTFDGREYKVTVAVTNERGAKDLRVTNTIEIIGDDSGEVDKVVFENTYRAETKAPLEIGITKELTGYKLVEDMFKFELYEGNISARNLKQTTYNTDVSLAVDGIYSQEIEFEGISYNQDDFNFNRNDEATKTYYLVEKPVDDKVPGYTYDSATYKIEVVFKDNDDGTISKVSETIYRNNIKLDSHEGIVFSNKYGYPWQLEGLKTLTEDSEKNLSSGRFTYVMNQVSYSQGSVGEIIKEIKFTNNNDRRITNGSSGKIEFPEIVYTIEDVDKKFYYHIYELDESTEQNPGYGYKFDLTEYVVEVSVIDNENGTISIEETFYSRKGDTSDFVEIDSDHGIIKVNYENKYTAQDVEVDLSINKTLNGRNWEDGKEFTFKLTQVDSKFGNPIDDPIQEFGDIKITSDELIDGHVSYATESITLEFKREKMDPNKDEATFYYILEELKSEDNSPYTHDPRVYKIAITVKDDDKGKLSIAGIIVNSESRELDSMAVDFVNIYSAKGSATITAAKAVNGKSVVNNRFIFNLQEVEKGEGSDWTTWRPKGDLRTIKNIEDRIEFNIEYSIDVSKTRNDVGEHYYILSEEDLKNQVVVGDGEYGYEYDERKYLIKVVIRDDAGDGNLKTKVFYKSQEDDSFIEIDEDGFVVGGGLEKPAIVFHNKYTASGSLSLEALKELKGRTLEDNQFEFLLEKIDGDRNVIEDIGTVSNNKDGSIQLPLLTYREDQVGTHYYKLSEMRESNGGKGGYSYDKTYYVIEVDVEDKDNGSLDVRPKSIIRVSEDGTETPLSDYNDLRFTNVYKAMGSATIEVTKNLEGKGLLDGKFMFTIQEVDENGASIDGGFTESIRSGVSNTSSFSKISYNENHVGNKFYYLVSETNEGADGYTYDDKTYKVTAEVKDNGDGTLAVNQTITLDGETVDKIMFNNTYNANGNIVITGKKLIKALDENQLKEIGNKFSFILKEADKEGNILMVTDEDGEIREKYTDTDKNDEFGNIVFSDIPVNEANIGDSYYYLVYEKEGDLDYYLYDPSIYLVEVIVNDNGDGTLDTTKIYYKEVDGKWERQDETIFVNTYDRGNLTILKALSGNLANLDDSFEFKVTFDNEEVKDNPDISYKYLLNGVEVGVIKSGETIELGHTDSVTIIDLPTDTKYKVEEVDPKGYIVTSSNAVGEINPAERAIATFTNTKASDPDRDKGNLTISKVVLGDSEDQVKFYFRIYLENAPGTYSYIGNGIPNGTIKSGDSFILDHGQSITILDLPVGARYKVVEANYMYAGYMTFVDGVNSHVAIGDIEEGRTSTASLLNSGDESFIDYTTGKLSIKKVVEGTGGDTNKRFDFIVTFTGDEEGYYYYEGRAGAPTGIITSGDTISLAHGENITICGLPEGVEYEVKEADYSKDGYTVVSTGESGTIDEDEDKLALFINTRNSGNLTIKKTVIGDYGEKDREFTFIVELEEGKVYNYTGSISGTIESGQSITLKHKEYIVIEDIVVSTPYKVIEKEANKYGYITTSTGASGTIGKNGETAAFVNSKSSVPKTGDDNTGSIARIALMILIPIFLIFIGLDLNLRRKRIGQNL